MTRSVSLFDAITLQRGFDLPTSQRKTGRYPVVTSTGMATTHDEFKVRGPGVVIGRSGSIGGGQYITGDFWPLNTTLWVKDFKANNEKFIYYLLKSLDFSSFNAGAAVPTLNRNHLSALKVTIPDRITQDKIANILGALDEKIELNRQMNETLEQMGQALFRHYFIDNPEVEKWGSINLGDKIKPRRGKSLQSKNMKPGAVPVISGGLKPAGLHDESNTIAPVITVSASGANAGFTALWDEDVWSADSSFIDTTITPHVYFYYLFLSRNQKRIYEMQTGSGQPHIYPSHLELLELPNAPELLIAEFNERVSVNFKKIEENKKQVQTLTTLRDTLLPRLINGKVTI